MSVTAAQDHGLIQDFTDATIDVLKTMAFFEVGSKNADGAPPDQADGPLNGYRDITGVLGFSGSRTGSILLTLSEKLALQIVGGMLDTQLTTIDSVVCDGIGELVNMISGSAKTRLQSKGLDFVLSIPHTIVGPNHLITAPASTRRTRIEFTSNNGDFYIDVFIKQEN
jgi:chemotaxis protein CheX